MSISIKVENLSKAYQLGQFSTGTLSRDLERWWAGVRGKEDPFLKIGEKNYRDQKATSDVVWSLRDVNFEIEQGMAVGVIGRNGAGKSTLLKILSQVTSPTSGNIKVKGRIASLLEVGTGFHPELTGKENIFLNGAILGMQKKEIKRKFDEIVDFSGVERYIDTPVKRYSSGMYVRLAFAVAAHLESEILIVDEVLAVGDAEFQKKCLGKMGEISSGQGRTLLFVSHNMTSINKLCEKSILMKDGEMSEFGPTQNVVASYLNNDEGSVNSTDVQSNIVINQEGLHDLFVRDIKIYQYADEEVVLDELRNHKHLFFRINLDNRGGEALRIRMGLYVVGKSGVCVFSAINDRYDEDDKLVLKPGNNAIDIEFPDQNLSPGQYFVKFWIKGKNAALKLYDYESNQPAFVIVSDKLGKPLSYDQGYIEVPYQFSIT